MEEGKDSNLNQFRFNSKGMPITCCILQFGNVFINKAWSCNFHIHLNLTEMLGRYIDFFYTSMFDWPYVLQCRTYKLTCCQHGCNHLNISFAYVLPKFYHVLFCMSIYICPITWAPTLHFGVYHTHVPSRQILA